MSLSICRKKIVKIKKIHLRSTRLANGPSMIVLLVYDMTKKSEKHKKAEALLGLPPKKGGREELGPIGQ